MFPLLLLPFIVVAGAAGAAALARKLYIHVKKRVALRRFSEKVVVAPDVGAEGGGDPCAICLEDFLTGEAALHLQCKHFFHKKCFLKFLRLEISVQACPLCRASF